MALADEIADCLRLLGDTQKQVAATLLVKQVRGVRNTVRTLNPVVRFVQISLKDEGLNLDVIPGDTIRCRFGKRKAAVPLPAPIIQFLEAFNAGKYPALELPSEMA